MTFLDLFAGIGGFRRGLELAGHKCVGFCEWDKFAAASYTSMHLITDDQRERLAQLDLKQRQKEILKEEYRNGEWYSADVRLIRGDNVPRADCWCFGAPCQDFSVAGKRAGLDGDRSSLVREVFRVLGELEEADRPEWLIYENVKGMLSSNRGWDFLAIILEMEQLGYDVEWELFNTKNFGIPQNRERVYTVGHLRSRGRRKIFPLEGADGEDSVCEVSVIGGIGEKNFGKQFREGNRIYDGTKIATALTSNVGNAGGGSNLYSVPITINSEDIETQKAFNGRHIVHSPLGVSKTMIGSVQGSGSGNEPKVAIPVLTVDRPKKSQNGRRFKEDGEASFTLTAQDRHGVALSISGYEVSESSGIAHCLNENKTIYAVWYEKYQCYIAIRKLTPRECFRLQGWTDDYFEKAAFVNSDSQLYKQAGNGVTVAVVEDIGKAIKGEIE